MLPENLQPYKADKVGSRMTLVDAYRKDLDFWGNGERKIYHKLTKSLSDFLVKNVKTVRDNTFMFWCDIGCGPGYFLEGVSATMRTNGPCIMPSGVDISPEALSRCQSLWPSGEFVEVNLDVYKRREGNMTMPWIDADVVSFIDTFQYFKDYRRTFNEIYDGLLPGAIIVVADGLVRSNLRDYPNSMPDVAFLGGWIDYSEPLALAPRKTHLKYRIYKKMM